MESQFLLEAVNEKKKKYESCVKDFFLKGLQHFSFF